MSTAGKDETPEEARARRSHWPVWKGRLSDLEKDEEDISPYTTIGERFEAMWQLAQDGCEMSGVVIDESTFPSNSGCIVRRES